MDSSKLIREIYPMPQDVEDILIAENLMETYRSRPPYQQNDYIGWIIRAKKFETRNKRIAQMIFELHDGHLYMGMNHHIK